VALELRVKVTMVEMQARPQMVILVVAVVVLVQ
jgi:hypothetical protein